MLQYAQNVSSIKGIEILFSFPQVLLFFWLLSGKNFRLLFWLNTHRRTHTRVPAVWRCGHFNVRTTNHGRNSLLFESDVYTEFTKKRWQRFSSCFPFQGVLQMGGDKAASVYNWINVSNQNEEGCDVGTRQATETCNFIFLFLLRWWSCMQSEINSVGVMLENWCHPNNGSILIPEYFISSQNKKYFLVLEELQFIAFFFFCFN